MKVESTAEFRTDNDEPLTASAAYSIWVNKLPGHATLTPIQIDQGTQREPWPVTVGMRASWDEER